MSGERDLDRTSPMPLWAQLEADLRARVAAGEFAGRFPTERELCGEYAVSRHTVREALRQLDSDGILLRERGRGSRVVTGGPRFDQPLGTLYSLFRSVESQGISQTSTVLAKEVLKDRAVADALELDRDADLVHIARLRFAAGMPLAIDRVCVPATIGAPLLEVDFTHTALYDELAQVCGVVIDGGRERIRATQPTTGERVRLRMDRGTAAFAIDRIGYSGTRPLEWRHTILRGDRFGLTVDWTTDAEPVMTMSADEVVSQ